MNLGEPSQATFPFPGELHQDASAVAGVDAAAQDFQLHHAVVDFPPNSSFRGQKSIRLGME